MAITVYTVNRAPLTSARERDILSQLFEERAVLSGGTIKAGTGWFVDRLPGTYVIRGVMIYDDALTTNWINLDTEETDDSGDRLYVFWVRFDPATDTVPTFGVTTSPTDAGDLAAIAADDRYLIIGIVNLPNGSTQALDGIYRRPDVRFDAEAIRRAALDKFVLSFGDVGVELSTPGSEGLGVIRLRWTDMVLVGERLDARYNIEGTVISVASPWGNTYAHQIEFPNYDYGMLFVRTPPDLVGAITSADVQLEWVGFESLGGQVRDDQASFYSSAPIYTLGDDEHPARPQRKDVRVVGYITPDGISWVNGAVTKIGSHSSQEFGDAHNVLGIKSTAYGTQEAPGSDGFIDIDNILTNAAQLENLSLQTAYDGPAGNGAGRSVLMEDGAVEFYSTIGAAEIAPEDQWCAAVRIEQAIGDGTDGELFSAALDVVDGAITDETKRRLAIRHRRIWDFGGTPQSAVAATLSYNGSRVSLTLTGMGAPTYADVDATGVPFYATFVGLPGGTTGHTKAYPVIVVGTELRVTLINGSQNIPALSPTDFGAMLSDVNCQVTLWEATLELGGIAALMDASLRVLRDLYVGGNANLGDGKVELTTTLGVNVDAEFFNPVTLQDALNVVGNLDVDGNTTLDNTTVDGTLDVTGNVQTGDLTCVQLVASGAAYLDGDAVLPAKTGLGFGTIQTFETVLQLLASGGWIEELSSLRYRAAAGGVVSCFFSGIVPFGNKLDEVRVRFQKIAAAAYTSTVSIYKIKRGVGGALTDTVAGSPLATGAATLATLAATDFTLSIPGAVALAEGEMILVVVDGENVLLSPVVSVICSGTAYTLR